MYLSHLSLRGFRNVERATLVADRHLNFLVGANGQGKTSFLEALSFLSTLRSFRGGKNEEVVQWGQSEAEVQARLSDPDGSWQTDLKVTFALNRPSGVTDLASESRAKSTRVAFVNGKPFRSSTQYLSQRFGSFELGFHSVVFSPADHDLVRGEPAIRRSYLDRVIAAESVEHLQDLTKYQRVLEQRNALLKSLERPTRDLLIPFSESLVTFGARIAFRRLHWLSRLNHGLDEKVHEIAPQFPKLSAIYISNWVPPIKELVCSNKGLSALHFAGQDQLPSLEILEQAFWTQLSALEAAELRSRSSLTGPHRDDWTFQLGGQLVKGHGSQGEVRSALLALKLREIELFREQTGHRPVLLLDDFSSELDREKRGFLLRYLINTDLQVFVTTTEDSFGVGKRFTVSDGRLSDNAQASGAGVDPAVDRLEGE